MAERSKAAVLKTIIPEKVPRVRPVIRQDATSRLFNGTRQGDKLVKKIEQNFSQLLALSYDWGRMTVANPTPSASLYTTSFPPRPACGGGLKLSVGIFLKIGSDFNQNIPPIFKIRIDA